ncbi:PREDICTED: uncharacterized protein LOC109583062 [Amphimedon queenslandica]|uniref:Uncharacterized protein n=1 Tax=Amphimedon queenslandica TaxID=400682 RepID=A0AAN0JAU5_AMPQE|nr:PREDICTED: uncharacterized protein LOC109583062 [Amphimedon queenslandica]|eukprot:XP_019853793.1 PREDICTED: uncharacterized protein LOC109583062 [Amphimedon queenslandica]
MTVYPQQYKLNCVKIGFPHYGISMSIGNTPMVHYSCSDATSCYLPCPGTVLASRMYTTRYTVTITWDGMTVSSGAISQSTTGDQKYQCAVVVTDQPTRRRNVTIKVPATAPSSLRSDY